MNKLMLAPLLLGSACSNAARPAPPAPPCDLTIAFGSYAMGIDRAALAAVRAILADRAVRAVEERGWGREGEVTLCVDTRRPADAERLFARISAVLPVKPRGPIDLRTASGLASHSPPRP